MSQSAERMAVPARFSTVGLPVARRLELWERYNADALIGLSCKTINGAPLEATEHNLWLPNVEIARVTGSPHLVERTVKQIRRHPANSAVLYVALAGEAFFYHQDGVRVLRPGQAVLCDADAPFVRGFAQGLAEFALKVPRTVFDGLSEGASLARPRVFEIGDVPGADGHGYALAKLMQAALRAEPRARAGASAALRTEPDAAPGDDRARLERELLGLLRAMVVGSRAGDAAAQWRAAQAFIERHLIERGLSASRVAGAVGISERQLSRVFSEHGGVARWITDRRLDRARDMLACAGPGGVTVGDVARECGFSSQSYFARAFKQRFDQTPVEVIRGGGVR